MNILTSTTPFLVGGSFIKPGDARPDFEISGLALNGWISLPTFSRSQTDMQFFYVNGRFVKDKIVSNAIKQA